MIFTVAAPFRGGVRYAPATWNPVTQSIIATFPGRRRDRGRLHPRWVVIFIDGEPNTVTTCYPELPMNGGDWTVTIPLRFTHSVPASVPPGLL